jgi:hypothetical protein
MRQQNDCEIVKLQFLKKTMEQARIREWMGYS